MIPYDELCAALEAYATRTRGAAAATRPPASAHAGTSSGNHDEPASFDPPTSEVALPDEPQQRMRASRGADEEEGTHMDGMPPPLAPVFDDKSNELDINDVLSDEESDT